MQRRLLLEVRRSGDAALLLSEGNRDANIQGALAAPYVLGSSRHLCRVEQGSTFELGEVHNYPADMNASATRPNGVAGHHQTVSCGMAAIASNRLGSQE